MTATAEILIRNAYPDDSADLERLALIDSHRRLTGRVLVAEVAGEVHAALEVETGASIANPFEPTAHLVELLSVHAERSSTRPAASKRFITSSVKSLAPSRSYCPASSTK